ncbi:GHKL domain-containing protein [Clostridium tertium]|uniref:Sensor protein CitS n=1 Tax=Clostridium tertium TaxID=1559 RepID=A0A6N3G6L9_9CLOT
MVVLMIFIEMMLNVILYNGLFNNGKLKNIPKYCVVVAICSYLFYRLSAVNILFVYVILLVLEIIAIAYIDKKDKNVTLTEMIICVVVTFVLQNSIVTILYLFTGLTKELRYIHLLIYALGILVLIIGLKIYREKKDVDFEEYIENNLLISNIIINIFMFFMIFKIIYDSGKLPNLVIIEINMLIFVNIFLNISFYKSLHKTILKNKNLEVKNAYNPLLDEIIQNIRANEHEYKNHINMLYSMIQVSQSIPEMKERAGKYVVNIQNTNDLSSILEIESTVVKAVLYSKIVECEQHEVSFKYNIKSNIDNSELDDSEITIILSNLLNNAIEASKNALEKNVIINITKLEKYRIEVKNSVKGINISNEDIEGFFKKGFSSKGTGRGYGLYNVKNIVKKHKGNIYGRLMDNYLVIEIFI